MRQLVLTSSLLAMAVLPHPTRSQNFNVCQHRAEEIWNGTDTEDFTQEQIEQFLYHGPVMGMNPLFNRSAFITITTEGCRVLCQDPTDWYWYQDKNLALGITSNWVLPIIALLAALPYESLHRRNDGAPWCEGRLARTLVALLNWLGSPQTALAATLFNIHQIRKCMHATSPSGMGVSGDNELQQVKRDAYYVLSVVGQFKLRTPNRLHDRFLVVLTYGLFRPLISGATEPDVPLARSKTRELLQQMAFQLRMLRRRGVYPTFASIFVFFVAFGVSLVFAFADVGERTTAHSLALGILVSWLPLMVMFTILDRNPMSADRTKILIVRWLWNVDAVQRWAALQGQAQDASDIDWWSQEKEDDYKTFANSVHQQQARQAATPGDHGSEDPERQSEGANYLLEYIGQPEGALFNNDILEFVGQGREIGYGGLAHAVLWSVYDSHSDDRQIRPLGDIAKNAGRKLAGHRPGSWRLLSLVSLGLVWVDVSMAILIAYNTPTVGWGCWSGSYMTYGLLSSLPWALHSLPSFKHPRPWQRACFHLLNAVSTLWLIFILFAHISGVFNDCVCKSALPGYMDFASSVFYRDHFDVDKWWKRGAIVGALPSVGSSLASVLLLMRLKPLWQASEQQSPPACALSTDMAWLR
ncbi:hypothetical protein EDB81DRAFT_911484 [Dactylonectria macrodidyma]|uniref:Uncharacterized protein n=1 Tax=Dactylonectria macrodidyma TaxID=307937 RepID=A0A9P9DRX3_9HYPO|nr:hypothetical protein EDB81DRAFT_911484 [Dactylonectria macrodidyma]